jgi:hypothetical protein
MQRGSLAEGWRFYLSPGTATAVVDYIRHNEDLVRPDLNAMNLRLYGHPVVLAPMVPDGSVYFVEG